MAEAPLAVGIGGEPGVGKSRLMRRVLAGLAPGRPFVFGLVRGTIHDRVLVLGDYTRNDSPGTDRLSMSVHGDAVRLLGAMGRLPAEALLFEGDRLFTRAFLEAVRSSGFRSRFLLLRCGRALLETRRESRGDAMAGAFLAGRVTKYRNLEAWMESGVQVELHETPAQSADLAGRILGWLPGALQNC